MSSQYFKTLPWNGYKAAMSLTFDDGDPSQLQVAIPEMAKRGIRGTFYLIYNRLTEIETWKNAFQDGQELGNHSLDHKHAVDLTSRQCIEQVKNARENLENTFQVSAPTFAYPFTEITPALREAAGKNHFLSRGGYGPVYFHPDQELDWDYLPSQVIYTHTSSGILKGWAEENVLKSTWSIPQFHAFTGSTRGWQPFPTAAFIDFLDDLEAKKDSIWIAPLGEVGAYRIAETHLQKAVPRVAGNEITYSWKRPPLLPAVSVKIRCDDAEIWQNGKKLDKDTQGHIALDFSLEKMSLIRAH